MQYRKWKKAYKPASYWHQVIYWCDITNEWRMRTEAGANIWSSYR